MYKHRMHLIGTTTTTNTGLRRRRVHAARRRVADMRARMAVLAENGSTESTREGNLDR